MARKDHLITIQEDSKLSKKFLTRNNAIVFQAQVPTIAQQINNIGATSKTPDEVKDTKFPILGPINEIGKNISDVLGIDLSLENSPFHCIELSDVGATVATLTVNFTNLVKNKAEKFILDITKDVANTIDPNMIFSPIIENLPAGFPFDQARYLLEIVSRETPTETRFEVISGGTGGGVTFPLTPNINPRGNVSGIVTVDLSLVTAHYQEMVLIGNITFVFSNPPADNKEIEFLLDITQDATGGRTIQWPPEVRVEPTVGSGANARTLIIVSTVDNGTNYDALIVTGGTVNAANKTLSNLIDPTAISVDLLFSASTFDIGGTVNPPDRVFTQALRLETGGSLLSTAVMIRNNATHLQMNVPVNTDAYEFAWAGTNRATFTAPGDLSLLSVDKANLKSDLQFQNIASDPAVAGNMRMNGTDVKVFSGGAVRNMSDIGSGGGSLPHNDNQDIIQDDVDNTKKLRFSLASLATGTTIIIGTNTLTVARTYSFPDITGTVTMLGGTQTFTGSKTFNFDILVAGGVNLGSSASKVAAGFFNTIRFDASTQFITADASGMRFELPTADVFNWEISNVDQLTLSSTVLNVHGNDITNTGNITSTSGNVDVGDSTGFDAFFGRRIEFPNNLGVITATNREIVSTSVSAVNTIQINLPLNEDFIITENNVTSPIAFHVDMSSGFLILDNPLLGIRINVSSPFTITKPDALPAAFISSNGFTFNDILKILTPAGDTALELDGIDGAPDIGRINTPANVDFEYSAGGTNKMRFDASNNEFQFNADIVRIQERLNIKETTVTPPTPPTGQCTIFLFDDGGAEPNNTLRVKFDNGNVQTLATEV